MSEGPPPDGPPMDGPPPPPPPPYPPGTPEYDSWAAEDQGPTILILCWFFVALATVFMIGRLYARLSLFKKLKSDDYWCLASLFFAYMASSFASAAVDYGHGKHVQTLTQHQAEQVRLWTFAAFMPGVLVLGLPKVAVVTLLIRLLNPSKWHRYFLLGMVSWCVLSNIATIGTLAGQCTPTRAMWNFDIVPDCIDPDHVVNFSLYSGSLNAFVDIYLAIYPAIVLFKLQMRMRKKVVLSMALGIGVVGGIVAIYKTTRLPNALKSQDFSYDSGGLVYWSIIEASTTIIAATIPTLSPLMERIFKGRNPFASLKRSSKGGSTGGSRGFGWKGSKDNSKRSSEKHGSLPYPQAAHMDPYSPRRKTHDPDSISMDLGETIVGDSSEENFMPIQKTNSSKVHGEGEFDHRASGSTDVAPQHSPLVQHSPFVLGGDLESQDGLDHRRTSDSTDVAPQEHHTIAGNLESHPSYGSSSSDDSMDVAPREQRHANATDVEPHNAYNPFHSSRDADWPLERQGQPPAHGITRTSEVSVSYSSPRSSSQRSPPPRVSSPWTSVQ